MNARSITSILLGVVLAACGGFGYERPVVTVERMRLGGLGFDGGVLYVDVQVENPNGFDIRSAGLSYDIAVREPDADSTRWIRLAEGRYEEDIRIAGHSRESIEIPVRFTFADVGNVMREMLRTGVVEYTVSGAVDLRSPIDRSVPYRRTGTFALGS